MLIFKRFLTTQCYSPVEQLESLSKLSKTVNGTNSTIEKMELLRQFPASHSTLKRIYDPHLRHHVTSRHVMSYLQKNAPTEATVETTAETTTQFDDLNALLDALSTRSITGKAASDAVAGFYAAYCKTEAHQNVFWKILDRNLKMGVSVNMIKHLLSTEDKQASNAPSTHFKVALASSFSSTKRFPFNISDHWYASQKLDGIRCIAMVRLDNDDCNVQFYSRSGKPFTSLQKVRMDIQKRLKETKQKSEFVLDGEITAYDDDCQNENFLKALGEVRRLTEEMEKPIFQVFDYISLKNFLDAKGDEKFSDRQKQLKNFVGPKSLPHMKVVEQIKLNSTIHMESLQEEALEKGWEGLILRKDVGYEGKRTRNMIKLKEWEDAEYIVKSIETGLMRMPDTGEEKLVMTNVNIEHKGYPVGVGSGFSIQSRIAYAEDPDLIIGKPITVRYFSESKKEHGTLSLRFPTVKAVYETGVRDV